MTASDDVSRQGSAVVAAVLVAACFSLLAAQAARSSRSAVASTNAGMIHAQLAADADAGVALAVDGLTARNDSGHWNLDDTPHIVDFAGATLSITVEDERGKVPLNSITNAQATALFENAGADPTLAAALTEAFLVTRDPGRAPSGTPAGAERKSGISTINALSLLPGMTADLYDALAPSVTVDAGDVPFEPGTATPLALKVMDDSMSGSAADIEQQRERTGERTALGSDSVLPLAGRVLTIRVIATDRQGDRVNRATLIQLTGHGSPTYIVRQQPS